MGSESSSSVPVAPWPPGREHESAEFPGVSPGPPPPGRLGAPQHGRIEDTAPGAGREDGTSRGGRTRREDGPPRAPPAPGGAPHVSPGHRAPTSLRRRVSRRDVRAFAPWPPTSRRVGAENRLENTADRDLVATGAAGSPDGPGGQGAARPRGDAGPGPWTVRAR